MIAQPLESKGYLSNTVVKKLTDSGLQHRNIMRPELVENFIIFINNSGSFGQEYTLTVHLLLADMPCKNLKTPRYYIRIHIHRTCL